jgi:tetratricopeptide (TPR) repeat protein
MIEGSRHNIRAIRELLEIGFNVEELRGLFSFAVCYDLRPVADVFLPEDTQPVMVDKAIAYCRSRFLLDELLAAVKEDNPRAYARFEDRLYDALPPRGAPAVVRPLAADLPDFTGRDAQIDQLRARLDQQGAVTCIHGMGGIGKTALAVHVAHQIIAEGRFRDAQLTIDLKGAGEAPVDPAEALESLLNAILGPDPNRPRDLDTLAVLWRQAIDGKDALLILDNAADATQVRHLLPGCVSCAVLVTSRRRFALPGAVRLDLDSMQLDEAHDLLQELAPHLDQAAAETIAGLCGRLPLALRVAGNYLSLNDDVTPEEYGEMLADERTRLARLRDRDDPDLDVATAISLSVAQLDAEQRRAWTLLALFPAPFDLPAAAALWGEVREGEPFRPTAVGDDLWGELREGEGFDPADWDDDMVGALRQFLEQLAGPLASRPSIEALDQDETRERLQAQRIRSLVSYDRDSGRYLQHDLVRLAAGGELETRGEQEVEAARLRLARHYEGVARAAKELYKQGGEAVLQGLALFDREWPHIRAGQSWAAARAGKDAEASRLCNDYPDAAAVLLSLRLHPRDWIAWLEAAARAARRLGDREAEGNHLGSLGLAYKNLGEMEKAVDYYQQALVIARHLGDRRNEGTHLGNLGNACLLLGQMEKAVEHFEQALAIARETGDRQAEGTRLGSLGNACIPRGEMEQAVVYYQQAMVIARETGDRESEGNSLGNLGNAYFALGEIEKAVDHYQQALAIARQIGDRHGEGNQLGNLGLVHRHQGDSARAYDLLTQALTSFEAIEDPGAVRIRQWLAELED